MDCDSVCILPRLYLLDFGSDTIWTGQLPSYDHKLSAIVREVE